MGMLKRPKIKILKHVVWNGNLYKPELDAEGNLLIPLWMTPDKTELIKYRIPKEVMYQIIENYSKEQLTNEINHDITKENVNEN